MRRWRNLAFRRGQFQVVPPRAATVPPRAVSRVAPRFLPLPRRGRFAVLPPKTVVITVKLAPQSISHDAPRFLPLARRGRSSAAPVVVTVSVPLGISRRRAVLPLARRGRITAPPARVTVLIAQGISHDAPRFLPQARRGRYTQVPVRVIPPGAFLHPQPLRQRRSWPLRPAHGAFRPRFTGAVFAHPPICLGGTEATVVINGTALAVDPGYNGTITLTAFNGSMAIQSINGTETAWCMIAVNLTLGEFDDTSVNLAFTGTGGGALDISAATIDVYLKTAAGVLDTDASTKHYSSTGGSPAITITNGPGGLATLQIPAADIASASLAFWKASVTIGGKRNTAMYGTVTTTLL